LDYEKKERYNKKRWMKMFLALSRITYLHADKILTLFEGNRVLQIRDGADPSKIEVVPNGIDVDSFGKLYREEAPAKPVVALIGRVVPIKDIKTFIRAARIIRDARPDVQFRVIGPTDEDPEYFQDCLSLSSVLGLSDAMTFTGKVDVKAHLPELTCQVLTSISEGQPLVVLEGLAAGVPFVSTDVGSCKELADGNPGHDAAFGSAGFIAPIGSHEGVAEAVLKLVADPALRARMVEAGRARVGRYYRQTQVSARYQQIYEELPYMAALKAVKRQAGGQED
ncbi:MAG: GT4 family glycosyltransferase PelF, partial [Planctomycetota bacterium]